MKICTDKMRAAVLAGGASFAEHQIESMLMRAADEIDRLRALVVSAGNEREVLLAAHAGTVAGLRHLAQLGRWCLDESRQNDCSDIDGGSLQDKAIELGLLAYVDVAEPCNEACACLEYEGSDGFPTRCLRYTDRAVLDADR